MIGCSDPAASLQSQNFVLCVHAHADTVTAFRVLFNQVCAQFNMSVPTNVTLPARTSPSPSQFTGSAQPRLDYSTLLMVVVLSTLVLLKLE